MDQLTRTRPSHGLTEKVAERLRGRMAERRIRQKELMLATGWSKTTAFRKMNGLSPIDALELEAIWEAFGISPAFLFHGDDDNRPAPSQAGDQVSESASVRTRQGARPKLRVVVSND